MNTGKIILIILVCFTAGCNSTYQISQAELTQFISTIASDEMKGRRTFTPEIDKAAQLISDEFKLAGLEPLDGEDDYFQEFSMFSAQVKNAKVILNNEEISSSEFVIVSSKEMLEIDDKNTRSIIVGEGDDLRKTFSRISQERISTVVYVNPIHKSLFDRYRNFLSRPGNYFEGEEPVDLVMILTDEVDKELHVSANTTITERKLKNVAGMIRGKREAEKVLFSAHYDHIGIQKAINGDSIANGANDDASGTTAVVELAKYFGSRPKPERTLLFVAFTAEEVGGYGSRYFSQKLNPDHIIAMFNIEMIGKPAVSGPNSAWITGFDMSNFGKLLQESTDGTGYVFYPDPYPSENLFYRSDNATLARLGVPAHTISTTPIDVDPDYHQVSDEVETLNMSHMVNTIKAIATAAEGIISGKQTPTRVDPASVN